MENHSCSSFALKPLWGQLWFYSTFHPLRAYRCYKIFKVHGIYANLLILEACWSFWCSVDLSFLGVGRTIILVPLPIPHISPRQMILDSWDWIQPTFSFHLTGYSPSPLSIAPVPHAFCLSSSHYPQHRFCFGCQNGPSPLYFTSRKIDSIWPEVPKRATLSLTIRGIEEIYGKCFLLFRVWFLSLQKKFWELIKSTS